MKRNYNQKGFSLVETLIYVAIFGIFITGFGTFILSLWGERLHTQSMLEIHSQGTQAIHTITDTVRNARAINTPGVGSSGDILSITTTDPATDPTIFTVSGGVLTIKEGSAAAIPLTNTKVNASSVTFTNLSQATTPGAIQVHLIFSNGSESQRSQEVYALDFYGGASIR